jgi:hypothetical protein
LGDYWDFREVEGQTYFAPDPLEGVSRPWLDVTMNNLFVVRIHLPADMP